MTVISRAAAVAVTVALTGFGFGCGESGVKRRPSDAGLDSGVAPDSGVPGAAAVVGYWTGDWGDLVLRTVGNEMWGAYTHDQGTVRGRFADGVFTGWWAEVPSRLPNSDAGEVQFTFITSADGGAMQIDGRWRYGDPTNEPSWREDWDLSIHSGDAEPAALAARFADTAAFVAHP